MPRIGDTVNAGLGRIDYSQLNQINALNSQSIQRSIANLGDTVAGHIEKRGDYVKARKVGVDKLDAVIKLFGDETGAFAGLKDQILNDELPLSQTAGLASSIDSMIDLGVEQMRNETELAFANRGADRADRRLAMDERRGDFGMETARFAFENQQRTIEQKKESENFIAPQLMKHVLEETIALEGQGFKPVVSSQALNEALLAADPEQQIDIYNAAKSFMPQPSQEKLRDIKVTDRSGNPMDITAAFNPQTGTFRIPEIVSPQMTGREAETIQQLNSELGIPQDGLPLPGGLGDAGTGVLPPAPEFTVGAVSGKPLTVAQQRKQDLEIQKLEGEVFEKKAEAKAAEVANTNKMASLQETIDLTNEIEASEGFEAAVGAGLRKSLSDVWGVPDKPVAGSPEAGTVALINQLKGKQFLTSVQKMKGAGLGALSDAEGKKLQEAAGALDVDMSEADLKKSLSKIRELLVKGVQGNPQVPARDIQINELEKKNKVRAKFGLPPLLQ